MKPAEGKGEGESAENLKKGCGARVGRIAAPIPGSGVRCMHVS